MPEYDGPERRSSNLELDNALAEIERLRDAATTLATAVSTTVQRRELEELKTEVRRDYLMKIYFMAAFSVAIVIIVIGYINFKMNHASASAKHGHAVIECLLGQPEASRTGAVAATAIVTCEQTVRP
jgi:hypothetical protein